RSVYGLYNARYGVQMVAPLAFFAAVLADRISVNRPLDTIHNWVLRVITFLSSLIRRYSGQIVLASCIVGQIFLNMSTGIISLQDSLYGIDCQPSHPIATYLAKHYDRGLLLANRFSSSTIDLGMDFKNVVYEGSGALWVQARKHPASTVNWIVLNP